jgi:L-2-hydroxyglutarate oxidase
MQDTKYDVIIGGAGIVGLATALKIIEKNPKTKLLILEKEEHEAVHQSGHNSGVIHSGIYYKPGSLKASNCVTGYKMLIEFCRKYDIVHELCGKVIVATESYEIPILNDIYKRGIANGLDRIKKINKDELLEIEPFANGLEAVFVPYTGIIDFKTVCSKFAELINLYSGVIKYKNKITSIKFKTDFVEITSEHETFPAKLFINCCGLQSDEIASLSGENTDIRIIPFRGEYYKIKKNKRNLVKNLIYPVPNPEFPFLGVHFTRMTDGEVEAGPNAVLAFKKEGYKKTDFNIKDTFRIFGWKGFRKVAGKYFKTGLGEFYRSYSKRAFVKALKKLVPEITENDIEKGGAGVRAQAISYEGKLLDDFVIHRNNRIINVLNAPSPAATSCLSIGDTISLYISKN